MRNVCKKMWRCSNNSCNINLQKELLTSKIQQQSSAPTCPAGKQQNSPLISPGKLDPSAAPAVVSRLSVKVIVHLGSSAGHPSFLSPPLSPASSSKAPHHLREGREGLGESRLLSDHMPLRDLSRLPSATKSFPILGSHRSNPLFSLAYV